MIIVWRISFWHTMEHGFKDRDVWLDTDELDPLSKGAVEACEALERTRRGRNMVKYRHLFKPQIALEEMEKRVQTAGHLSMFCIPGYHEDEEGKELTAKQIAVHLVDIESAVMLPRGAKHHDIEYVNASKPAIDVTRIHLSAEQVRVLGYFTRDLEELSSSTFFKEGPGTLSGVTVSQMILRTAVSDEEIRSFVTIFRRLYMLNEPANLSKAAAVFATAINFHPAGAWVAAGAAGVIDTLNESAEFSQFLSKGKAAIARKLLIDVFLYTQYAHQPNHSRSRQFQQCLRDVGNDREVLTFMFLNEIWSTAVRMVNVGQYIAELFEIYCESHKTACDVITSPGDANLGIGSLEKSYQMRERILTEKAGEMAIKLWHEAGCPPGGSSPFVAIALAQLRQAMGLGKPTETRDE